MEQDITKQKQLTTRNNNICHKVDLKLIKCSKNSTRVYLESKFNFNLIVLGGF